MHTGLPRWSLKPTIHSEDGGQVGQNFTFIISFCSNLSNFNQVGKLNIYIFIDLSNFNQVGNLESDKKQYGGTSCNH